MNKILHKLAVISLFRSYSVFNFHLSLFRFMHIFLVMNRMDQIKDQHFLTTAFFIFTKLNE